MSNPLNAPYMHALIERFEWNARSVFEDSAPLYFKLTQGVIGDPKLLVLASHIPPHQPAPNLFFSSVHYLLLKGDGAETAQHPLRAYFSTLVPHPKPPGDAYPIFRDFVLTHADEMREL